jgi:hypothetical protein
MYICKTSKNQTIIGTFGRTPDEPLRDPGKLTPKQKHTQTKTKTERKTIAEPKTIMT